ncbi:hypothetical protein GIB67_029458 [Kingdonia uniflora]|uniref:No apical meristem-associated C-terminal domain-containing protein n=1 Tax=Kingdonia uniflora TaxID=39325 RepID=A0A7J7NY68_9MAGN|nr:hypothetical protein GIB67_029458 [Kingdonia uniflora]
MASLHAKKAEAGEWLKKKKNDAEVLTAKGDTVNLSDRIKELQANHVYVRAAGRKENEQTKESDYTLELTLHKEKELQENDAHKIYKGLNGGNDFKHHEAYKILAREPRWANLRDDGLNHAVNIPRNVARRTSDNSSPGNSVGSNNLSEDPDGPPTSQFAGPNFNLDGSLYEGGSRPIGQNSIKRTLQHKRTQIVTAQSKIRSSEEDEDIPGGSPINELDNDEDI